MSRVSLPRRRASVALAATLTGALLTGALLAVVAPAAGAAHRATSVVPRLRLVRVSDIPGATAIAARKGDSTLYVTQQPGQVRAIRNGRTIAAPVLDLTARVSQEGGERGLLGIAFAPDGAKLYVDYTGNDGTIEIDEFTMRGRSVDAATRRTVLTVEHSEATNHNGGQLAFGPDGDLYIGVGDGGGFSGDSGTGHAPGGNGQSLGTLLGKILRIDPTASGGAAYTVPPDNPFVGTAGARPEIWAYGLRNPWRFSFDRATGDLWIGDVGQDAWEEIDHAVATDGRDAGRGDNFGWNHLEGTHPFRGAPPAGAVPPVYEVSHTTGVCAIIGGFVYRGTGIRGLAGSYLFSDECASTIRTLVPAGTGTDAGVVMHTTGVSSTQVSSFGQDNSGRLYVLSLDAGVFRVDRAH
jgi:glucose/arabinose dehydrogenase